MVVIFMCVWVRCRWLRGVWRQTHSEVCLLEVQDVLSADEDTQRRDIREPKPVIVGGRQTEELEANWGRR